MINKTHLLAYIMMIIFLFNGCSSKTISKSHATSTEVSASYERIKIEGNDKFWGAVSVGMLALFLSYVAQENKNLN